MYPRWGNSPGVTVGSSGIAISKLPPDRVELLGLQIRTYGRPSWRPNSRKASPTRKPTMRMPEHMNLGEVCRHDMFSVREEDPPHPDWSPVISRREDKHPG